MEKDINYWIAKCTTLQQELDMAHERADAILNKACEWLESHIDDYEKYDTWRGWYTDSSLLIEGFKKAMEE